MLNVEQYLDTIASVAKDFRGTFSFAWSEVGAQPALEEALGISFAPTIAVMSAEKKVFSIMRVSWSEKNIKSFLNDALSGKEKMASMSSVPTATKVSPWDGKDAEVVQDAGLEDWMKD
jgi:thioredoxin-like negative regulator of GroEL